MPTTTPETTQPQPAAVRRLFAELICTDPSWVAAEFDAVVAANFIEPPAAPPPWPGPTVPGPPPRDHADRMPGVLLRRSSAVAARREACGWQRAPPGPHGGNTGAHPVAREATEVTPPVAASE